MEVKDGIAARGFVITRRFVNPGLARLVVEGSEICEIGFRPCRAGHRGPPKVEANRRDFQKTRGRAGAQLDERVDGSEMPRPSIVKL